VLALSPNLLPLLVVAGAGGILLLKHPQWIVPCFIALTWSGISSASLGGLPSPVELTIPALLLLAAWYAFQRRELARAAAVMLLLVGLPMIAAGFASPEGPGVPITGLKELAFLAVAALCLRTFEDVDRAAIALAAVGVFLGLGAMFTVLVQPLPPLFPLNEVLRPGETTIEAPRAAGPFGEANFFALSLAALVPIAMYLLHGRGWRQVLGLVAGACLAGGLFATGSRGATLAAGVAVVAIGLLSGVPKLRVAAVVLLLTALAMVPLFAAQASSAQNRTVEGRVTENLVAIAMFNDYPLLGVGPDRYSVLYRDYTRRIGNDKRAARQPHSLPLQIAAEQGLWGLLGWVGAGAMLTLFVWGTPLWNTLLGKALVVSVIAYLVASLSLHGSRLRLLFVIVGMLLALASALNTQRNERTG
jgi:O-antigen ligase